MSKRKRIARLLVVGFLLLYVGTYLVLSRRGFEDADRSHICGFYFFPPEDTDSWRLRNYAVVYLYYPLIEMEQHMGTGRAPAKAPLFRLSRPVDAEDGR